MDIGDEMSKLFVNEPDPNKVNSNNLKIHIYGKARTSQII